MWSVPAVAVATAAPAFAGSGPAALPRMIVDPGTTAVVVRPDGYLEVALSGLSVQLGADVTAGSLKMSVTFIPYPESPQQSTAVYPYGIPAGWSGVFGEVAHYSYDQAAVAGEVIPLGDATLFGTMVADQFGTFVVTFEAPGNALAVTTFDTPRPPA
jgi:hypothetical protein